MRVLAGHVAGVVALQLLGGCGSSPGNDFFAEAPTASGGSSGGALGSSGASAAGSGGSVTSQGGGSSGSGGALGGSGGSGGSGPTMMFSGEGGFASDEEPIDDMEDGNARVLEQSGRDGSWFVIADPTQGAWTSPGSGADFSMAWNPTPRGESLRAAELMGGGFQQWGAGLVFNLRAWTDGPLPSYDASSYSGVSFYGRSGQSTLEVTVEFPDVNSNPDGGVCGSSPKPPCYQHFHSTVMLTNTWQKFRVPFSSLSQSGGNGGTFTASKLYSVQFVVDGETTFDLWVDDVAFIH